MPKYTFTFKKDDMFVEFSTTDKDIVERQFQIWVADADDYAKGRRGKFNPAPAPVSASVPQYAAQEEKKEVKPEPVKTEPPISEPEEKKTEIIKEEIEEKGQETEEKEASQEVLDKASTLLKTINTIQAQPQEETPAPVNDFSEVLEKSIENPTFEPVKAQDPVFLNLVKSKNTKDKFHYLMITAYYLSEFDKAERFSLKQINAKLMQNINEVIDHATLQEAINQGFVEVVPDLTGTSEVAEYRLTHIGEEFFVKI